MRGRKISDWNPSFICMDGTKMNIRNIVWTMGSYDDGHRALRNIESIVSRLSLGGAPKMSGKIETSGDTWYVILLWKRTLAPQTYKAICAEIIRVHGTICDMSDSIRDLVEKAICEWNAPAESGLIIINEQFFSESGIFVRDFLKPV